MTHQINPINTPKTPKTEIGFTTACAKFFGRLPGQDLASFRDELAHLTPADRADLTPLLSAELGILVIDKPNLA
jgi:hypothetical protein